MALTQEQQNIKALAQQVGADYKAMFSRVGGLPVNIQTLNVSANGSTDDTAAIKAALSDSNRASVYFPKGTYNVSAPIPIADNLIVRFDRQAVINVTADFAQNIVGGNDGRYVFLPGNNVIIDSANIDCKGKKAGGICVIQRSNVLVKNCSVKNWRDGLFGIADIGANQVWYAQNYTYNGFHGIHSYKSTNVTISENTADLMLGGGIYTAWSYRVSVVGNIVSNCVDVGVDFEGGAMCTSSFNTVERCANGELALFSGNGEDSRTVHHLIHQNNTVHRQAKYTAVDGSGNLVDANVNSTYAACVFMSVAAGCYEVGFKGNTIVVDATTGLHHTQLGDNDRADRNIFFTGNTVVSSAGFFRCLNSIGLRFTRNDFYGRAGAETVENEFRDASGAEFSYNTFKYDVVKTAGFALLLNTNTTVSENGNTVGWAKKPAYVGYNTFVNAGAFALKVDLFRNGSLSPTLRSNSLGDSYTTNGGLTITSNGDAILKDQRLKIKLPTGETDFTSIDGVNRAGIAKASGTLGFGRVGYNGLLATLFIVKGSGNINVNSTTNCPASGMSVTTNNNSKVTLSADATSTGSGVSAYLDLEVNTY